MVADVEFDVWICAQLFDRSSCKDVESLQVDVEFDVLIVAQLVTSLMLPPTHQ